MTKCLFLLLIALCSFANNNVKKPIAAYPKTEMVIVNTTNSPVTVWVTLGATAGCLQDVKQIPYVSKSLSNLVGSFTLAAHDSTKPYAPENLGWNGAISFNTQPLNCPTPQLPNGVDLFEFIVNNNFQAGIPQETIDISCVAGANALMFVRLNGGGAWNAGSVNNVKTFYNKLDKNSGLVGVYPYGCDICTGKKAPPSCVKNDNDKQKQPICNVQRDAKGKSGGIITLYLK